MENKNKSRNKIMNIIMVILIIMIISILVCDIYFLLSSWAPVDEQVRETQNLACIPVI